MSYAALSVSGCVCFVGLLCPDHLVTMCLEQAGERSPIAVISSYRNVRNSVRGVRAGLTYTYLFSPKHKTGFTTDISIPLVYSLAGSAHSLYEVQNLKINCCKLRKW